jgi:hypothetical protein
MIDHVPDAALEALIKLGTAESSLPDPTILERLSPFDAINRLNPNRWNPVTESLSEEAHAALARGLVVAEETLHWSGGSVAAAIWVYLSFARKFPGTSDALAEWMLAHSSNPWVPFGSNRGAARSIGEVREFETHRAEHRIHVQQEAALREQLADARRATARRLDDLRQKVSRAEGQARRDLIEQLSTLPFRDRLLHIAADEVHPLHFYPTELAMGAAQDLDDAGRWALDRLKEKASLIPKGPWKMWLKSHKQPREAI